MNVAEILLASVAALLALAGGTYMYGATLDQRSADRINAVLAETAANAVKAGPRIAEMSRANVQKLGIVPEAILSRRSRQSKQNGGIAWKNWIATTGKAGVELVTAGVRENGKSYFRIYLEGVDPGVCARVFADQVRESRWTSLGVSNEAKMERGDAEADHGSLQRQCAADGYDGRMLFEIELGHLAVVYLSPDEGAVPPPADNRTEFASLSPSAPAAGGSTWTRDLSTASGPVGTQTDAGLAPDIDSAGMAQEARDAVSGDGEDIKEQATGDSASWAWNGAPGGHGASVYGDFADVVFPGYNTTFNTNYSSGNLPNRNSNGDYNVIGDAQLGTIQDLDAALITNIYFNSNGDNADDSMSKVYNIGSMSSNFVSSNFESIINERVDVDPGNSYTGDISAVYGYPGGFESGSTFNAEANMYVSSSGRSVNVTANGFNPDAAAHDTLKMTEDSSVFAAGRVFADLAEMDSGSSVLAAYGGPVDGSFGDGSSVEMLGEVYAAGGGGSDNAMATGIDSVVLHDNAVQDGAVLSGSVIVRLDGGAGNDSIQGGTGIGKIGKGSIEGGDLHGFVEAIFDGGDGDDSFKSCYGMKGFDAEGSTPGSETSVSGGALSGEVEALFVGGAGSDTFEASYGMENISPTGELSGGFFEGRARCNADGGEDADVLTGCAGIGSIEPGSFTGGEVSGTSESILSGGGGADTITGGYGIQAVSAEPTDGAVLSGNAFSLLFGDHRIPVAMLLNLLTGSGLEEDDAEGIVNLLSSLPSDKLAVLDEMLHNYELADDGRDHLYGAGSSHGFSREQNVMFGGGDSDTLAGGSGPLTENFMFGGTGSDTVAGGANGALNIAFGGIGKDAMTGGAGDGTRNEFHGGTGADEITGGEGAENLLYGDADDDLIRGGDNGAVNNIWGGTGHDMLYGGDCAESYIWAGDDGSMLYGGNAAGSCESMNALYGGAGADTLAAGAGIQRSYLFGGAGNDTLAGGTVGTDGGLPTGDLLAGDGANALVQALDGSFSKDNPAAMRDAIAAMDADGLRTLQTAAEIFEVSGGDALPWGGTSWISTDGSDIMLGVNSIVPSWWVTDAPEVGVRYEPSTHLDSLPDPTLPAWDIYLTEDVEVYHAVRHAGDYAGTVYVDNGVVYAYSMLIAYWDATVEFEPASSLSAEPADGADIVTGSSGGDVILAGGGAVNKLYGMLGNDRILGGSGDDIIFGGDAQGSSGGVDQIFAGSGHDIVWFDADDAIDCGTGTDVLLNAAHTDIPGTTDCEYGLVPYVDDGSDLPVSPDDLGSNTVVFRPGEENPCTGNDVLLGADADDLAANPGCVAALELVDPELAGATSLEGITPETLAQEMGIVVDGNGTVWIMDATIWSPTDSGAWRNDAANWMLHGGDIRIYGGALPPSCSEDELGSEEPNMPSYAGWDKLYGVGVGLTLDKEAVTLSSDWKITNDGRGYVNCRERLVISARSGVPFYKWP